VQAAAHVNQTSKLALGAAAVVLLAAGGLYARFRTPEASDAAIVDFVYDTLLATRVPGLRACEVIGPVTGIVLVETTAEAITITGWKDAPDAGLAEPQRSCVAAGLKGASGKPKGVNLPPGRAYEVDVSLDIPQTGLQ
jgi:hypothetical protein